MPKPPLDSRFTTLLAELQVDDCFAYPVLAERRRAYWKSAMNYARWHEVSIRTIWAHGKLYIVRVE